MPRKEKGAKVSQHSKTEPEHPSDFKRALRMMFSATASASMRYQFEF